MTITPRTRGALLMIASLAVQVAQAAFEPSLPDFVVRALGFVAGLLGMVGGATYIESKGYSKWAGLLGLLSIFGIGLLVGIGEASTVRPAVRRFLNLDRPARSDDEEATPR